MSDMICDMTHWYAWHDSFIHPWHIESVDTWMNEWMSHVTHITRDMPHSFIHDSFILWIREWMNEWVMSRISRVTCLIHSFIHVSTDSVCVFITRVPYHIAHMNGWYRAHSYACIITRGPTFIQSLITRGIAKCHSANSSHDPNEC